MRRALILGALLLSGCVPSQQMTLDRDPLIERFAGRQEKLASCAYLKLERDHAEGLRMVELKGLDITRIYQEMGVYQNVRVFDVALIQETPETVRTEIRGFPTIYGGQSIENEILPVVRSCARS
jgi:hypothetical protein